METLNEKQGKHCPNIKKGGMILIEKCAVF